MQLCGSAHAQRHAVFAAFLSQWSERPFSSLGVQNVANMPIDPLRISGILKVF